MAPDLAVDLNKRLVKSGVNSYRSDMISRFVSSCVTLTHLAQRALIEPRRWGEFLGKRGALTHTGTSSMRSRVKETAISADICLEASRILTTTPVLKPGRRNRPATLDPLAISTVIADKTEPSVEATGDNSHRPDLVFSPACPELQIQFSVEAKVLEDHTDGEKSLLGADGLGCYTRAVEPYATCGVVGLYGYALSTEVDAHTGRLHAAFVAGKGAAVGSRLAVRSKHRTHWASHSLDNEHIVAELPSSLAPVCVTIVLGLPQIRLDSTKGNSSKELKTDAGQSASKPRRKAAAAG